MNKCIECAATNFEGALFCSECGRFLLESPEKFTTQLPFTEYGRLPSPPPLIQKDVEPATEQRDVTFVIPSSRHRLQLTVSNEAMIGRGDQSSGIIPEIDLTEVEGDTYGVSRQHAKLQNTTSGLALIDLQSTNGTYLNNFRLSPHQRYLVNTGDEIQFGELLVHVFINN